MIKEELIKKEEETLLQYRSRLYRGKFQLGLTNKEIYEIYCNVDDTLAESSVRCSANTYNKGFEEGFNTFALRGIKNKSKMDIIKEELGELYVAKEENKSKLRKLNKIKRDFCKAIEISEDIKEYLTEELSDNIEPLNYKPLEVNNENVLIVQVADWHIGYVIKDYLGNSYNYEVAKRRLSDFTTEIKATCELYNINKIMLVNCGDITEGIGMRQNQSYECEFNMNEQISKAMILLYQFALGLSEFANVDIITVGGNHQRGQGNKDANVEGDNNNIVIKEGLEAIINASKNERLKVLDVDFKDDSCRFNVCGKSFLAIHGDNRPRDFKKLYDNEKVDYILLGHYHNFQVLSQDNGGKIIIGGCLFGYNPYSVKKMCCKTKASQTLVVVDSNGINMIKDVILQ